MKLVGAQCVSYCNQLTVVVKMIDVLSLLLSSYYYPLHRDWLIAYNQCFTNYYYLLFTLPIIIIHYLNRWHGHVDLPYTAVNIGVVVYIGK